MHVVIHNKGDTAVKQRRNGLFNKCCYSNHDSLFTTDTKGQMDYRST